MLIYMSKVHFPGQKLRKHGCLISVAVRRLLRWKLAPLTRNGFRINSPDLQSRMVPKGKLYLEDLNKLYIEAWSPCNENHGDDLVSCVCGYLYCGVKQAL